VRDSDYNDLPSTIPRDLLQGAAGNLIGRGSSRAVYEWLPDPKLVLKIETTKTFQNVMEWEVYAYLAGSKMEQYLAEPIWIGAYGSVMLMKRTQPINDSQLPKILPDWLSDRKRENFGWLDGKVVCHDYGVSNIIRLAEKQRFRPVKPDEWR